MELRASLRRQEILLLGALHEVQGEVRCWNQHREAERLAGRTAPRELCILWEDLAQRERELALDLMQVRSALQTANAEVVAALRPHNRAS